LLGEHGLDHIHHGALPGLGQLADALQLLLQLGRATALARGR